MDFAELRRFYSGKSVLVTGHTGFKGAWLSLAMEEFGADVVGFSINLPTKPCMFESLKLGMEDVRGDIRDYDKVKKVISDHEFDVIFHLAAQPILLDSYTDPVGTFSTNVMGTLNVLEAARKHGKVKAIINVTTDKVYENKGNLKAYVEDDKLGGYDPYSTSKACSELVSQSYRRSFFGDTGIGLATARAGNVMGGGDWGEHRLIPDLVRGITGNERVLLRNPTFVRPWQYVLDALFGYMRLAELLYQNPKKYGGAYNFSSLDKPATAAELAKKFVSEWGAGEIAAVKPKAHEDMLLLLDSSKSRKELGWESRVDFDEMIRLAVEWYKAYYSKGNMDEHSRSMLKRYME